MRMGNIVKTEQDLLIKRWTDWEMEVQRFVWLNESEIGRGNNPVVLETRVRRISDLVERPLILAPKEMLTAVMDSWRLHALLPSTLHSSSMRVCLNPQSITQTQTSEREEMERRGRKRHWWNYNEVVFLECIVIESCQEIFVRANKNAWCSFHAIPWGFKFIHFKGDMSLKTRCPFLFFVWYTECKSFLFKYGLFMMP